MISISHHAGNLKLTNVKFQILKSIFTKLINNNIIGAAHVPSPILYIIKINFVSIIDSYMVYNIILYPSHYSGTPL